MNAAGRRQAKRQTPEPVSQKEPSRRMSVPIEKMRNLGPATARMLAEIDILDEDGLRALGAAEAYRRLKFQFGRHVSIIALYAMEAALRGCDWRALDAATKDQLRRSAT
jgi:DNA transformation protein